MTRYLLIPLLLWITALPLPLAAQNLWHDYIEDKAENSDYLVFAEDARVRDRPDLKGQVIFQLQPGNRVKVLQRQGEISEINGTKEYWYRIEYKNQTGYLWGGLLADVSAIVGKRIILIRNLGIRKAAMQIRLVEDGKTLGQMTWEPGPVGNHQRALHGKATPRKEGADYRIVLFKTKGFQNPPLLIFAVGYDVFSEIEMGWQEFKIFTLNQDRSLAAQFEWRPGSCDPPVCGESNLLFPGDTIAADPRIQRQGYAGTENAILVIDHNYDLDHPDQHEFRTREFTWDGKSFSQPSMGSKR